MRIIPRAGARATVNQGTSKFPGLWEGKIFDWIPMLGPTWGYGVDYTGLHAPSLLENMAPETDWTNRPSAGPFPGGWALKTASAGDDIINWGANSNSNNMSQITIAWWGEIVAHADNKRIVCKGTNSPTHTFGFRLITTGSAGGWGFEVSYGATDLRVHFDTSATERIAAGTPTLIVATWNGRTTASTSVKGYKNFLGPLTHFLDTNAVGARVDDSTFPLLVGNHTDTTTFSPNAYHYRTTIWRRELSLLEIRLLATHPLIDFNSVLLGNVLRDGAAPAAPGGGGGGGGVGGGLAAGLLWRRRGSRRDLIGDTDRERILIR